jgi:hypothetical protein
MEAPTDDTKDTGVMLKGTSESGSFNGQELTLTVTVTSNCSQEIDRATVSN